MKVAVLSLTRDRASYTSHCFRSLKTYAGCEFDHFILDQGSEERSWRATVYCPWNIGISRGMNVLLDIVEGRYDVIVKFDNDCELTQPDTLVTIARLALEGNCLLSPRILGLNNPPQPTGTFEITGETIMDIPQIGGIFLAAPARIFEPPVNFRYNPDNPIFGGDDVEICRWWRFVEGERCGYVERFTANHYEGTEAQHERYPEYWETKKLEMGIA